MSHETVATSFKTKELDQELMMRAELRRKAEELLRGNLDSKGTDLLKRMLALVLGVKPSEESSRGIAYLTSPEKKQLDVRFAKLAFYNPLTLAAIGLACAAAATDGHKPIVGLEFTHPAQEGTPLVLKKVRSMKPEAQEKELDLTRNGSIPLATVKKNGDDRITRVGHVIRKLSLDELPQLRDVLHEKYFSVVGPRPPSISEWKKLTEHLEEPPFREFYGLLKQRMPYGWTGLYFLFGRSHLNDPEDRWGLEVIYGREATLDGDLGILARTPGVWLSGRGAY